MSATPAPPETGRWPRRMAILMILLYLLGGCSLPIKMLHGPVEAVASLLGEKKVHYDPVLLQEDLLQYADNLTSVAVGAAMKLRQSDGQPIARERLLTLWIALSTDILTTATGSNALAGLIGLIILTDAGILRIEEYWMPAVFGESARPFLEGFRARSEEIWKVADRVLLPEQVAELHRSIESWRVEARKRESAIQAFASVSMVSEITRTAKREGTRSSSSVFSMLDLDPLAGLDPATREIAQTRLLAERAMYIGQRMPQILQWQVELVTIRAAQLPQVTRIIDNTSQLSGSAGQVGKLAEALPAMVSAEREAIFRSLGQERDQVFRSIDQERAQVFRDLGGEREKLTAAVKGMEPGLSSLSQKVGLAFGEGARMAASTDSALKSATGLMAELHRAPATPASEPSEPFRITDYGTAATEIAHMSDRLNALLASLQPLLSPESLTSIGTEVDAITTRTQSRGRELVDYAFHRLLQLLVAVAGLVLATALAYRYLSQRFAGAD